MNAKKVISLVLAVLMVFSMIPMQLISSQAETGLPDSTLGTASKFTTKVTQVASDADSFANCIDVQVYLKSDGTSAVTTLGETIVIDTNVLTTVSYNDETSNLSYYTKDTATNFVQFGDDFGMEPAAIKIGKKSYTFEFGGTGGCCYNKTTGKLYIFVCGMNTTGVVIPDSDTLVADVYLKLQTGKSVTDVPSAITMMQESEYNNATSGASNKAVYISEVSSKELTSGNVPDYKTLTFDSIFTPASNYDITFNWTDTTGAQTKVVSTASGVLPVVPDGATSNYSTADYDYTFTGWDKTIVAATGTTTYTAQYSKTADKAALQTEYDKDKGAVETEYTEATWTPFKTALDAASAALAKTDATKGELATALTNLQSAYAALAKKPVTVTHQITFIWQTAAGQQTITKTVNDGVTPTVPDGSTANYSSATKNFTFNWWDKPIVAATADATYIAQYNSADITYAITFVGNSGVITTVNTPINTVPTAPAVPSYESADGDTIYTFKAWNTPLVAATAAATYTATYDENPNYADYSAVNTALAAAKEITDATEYTAKYTQKTRTALATAVNAVVKDLLKSKQSQVDGYAEAINSAIGALALETYRVGFDYINKYTLSHCIGYDDCKYGDPLVPSTGGQSYTKDDYFYEFTGYLPAVPATVTKTETYVAQYKEGVFQAADLSGLQAAIATAKAKRDNGTRWTDNSVAALNEGITAAETFIAGNPGKSKQADVTIQTTTITNLAAALAEKPADEYTISFNWTTADGAKTEDVITATGTVPTVPAGSTSGYIKDDYSYAFNGWDKEIVAATAATTYTAQYTPTFMPADYTAVDAAIAAAALGADAQAKYTASSLNTLQSAINAVDRTLGKSQQTEVNAFAQAITDAFAGLQIRTYSITFNYHGGSAEQVVAYGSTPIALGVSDYSEGDYDYTFSAWDKEVVAVTGEATYTAQYDSKFVPANYTAYDTAVATANGILNTVNADKIYTAESLSAIRSILAQSIDKNLGRTSQAAVDAATLDLNGASGSVAYITYTITFDPANGNPVTSLTGHYGDTVENVPADPTKESTASTIYTFDGWTAPDGGAIPSYFTEDIAFAAQYAETTRSYTITFSTHDEVTTQSVKYNEMPVAPEVVNYTDDDYNYTFSAWDKEVVAVTGEATYTAQYTKEPIPTSKVTFIYFNEDGEQVTASQDVKVGSMPIIPEYAKTYTKDNTYYTFKAWNEEVIPVTDDAIYIAQYTSSKVFTPDMSEIEQLVARYEQMLKTGKYNKNDLNTVKAYIDDIYAMNFKDQESVDEMAAELKTLEDSCRKITSSDTNKNNSSSASTGDNATLVVMSVILVSSLGLAVVSLKRRKKEENM